MRVETSTVIKREPEPIFEFITAPENAPRWQEGAISTRLITAGPLRLGSEMEHVGRWLGMRMLTRAVVTVLEPGSAFGYDITAKMSSTPSRMRYSLTRVVDGTRLTLSNEFAPPGLMKPLNRLLQRSIQRMFDRDVERLRRVLEEQPPKKER